MKCKVFQKVRNRSSWKFNTKLGTKCSFLVQHDDVITNSRWRTDAILEIVFGYISAPYWPINAKFGMDRWRIACRHRSRDQNGNFRKFTIRDSTPGSRFSTPGFGVLWRQNPGTPGSRLHRPCKHGILTISPIHGSKTIRFQSVTNWLQTILCCCVL